MIPGHEVYTISLKGLAPKDNPLSLFRFANQNLGQSTVMNKGMIPAVGGSAIPSGMVPPLGLQSQMFSAQPQVNPMMPPPIFPNMMLPPQQMNMPPPNPDQQRMNFQMPPNNNMPQ
ncbi:MAG: hypothetical protein MHMPM18_004432 [Marteilia pararefringens]